MSPPSVSPSTEPTTPGATDNQQNALDTLQEGSAEEVGQTVDQLSDDQVSELTDEVKQLTVSEQQDLAKNIATSELTAEQLGKIAPILDKSVLDQAVETHGSSATKTNYETATASNVMGRGDPVERAKAELQEKVDKVKEIRDRPLELSTDRAVRDIDAAIAATEAMEEYRRLALSLPPDQAARFVLETKNQLDTIGYGLNPTNAGDASGRYRLRQDTFAAISRHVAGTSQAADVNEILAKNSAGISRFRGPSNIPGELSDLKGELFAAVTEAGRKDEELAALLSFRNASEKMSDDELKSVIDHFRSKPENKSIYDRVDNAREELGKYISDNTDYLVAVAKQNGGEDARKALLEGLDAMQSSGKETDAARIFNDKILNDPEFSQTLRNENPELFDQALEGAAAGAAAEIAKNQDEGSRNTDSLFQEFTDKYPNLLSDVFSVQQAATGPEAIRDGFRAAISGDASKLANLPNSVTTRILGAAGFVLGSANASLNWEQGEYDKFISDSANAGAGLLTALGKMTTRGVPVLGVVANGATLIDALTKQNPNGGDHLVVAGGITGLVGSGLLLAGTVSGPAGLFIVGTGAIITGIGSFISNRIEENKAENDLKNLLRDSGIDNDRIDQILGDASLTPGGGGGSW